MKQLTECETKTEFSQLVFRTACEWRVMAMAGHVVSKDRGYDVSQTQHISAPSFNKAECLISKHVARAGRSTEMCKYLHIVQ